jgi:hypothetical protein
MQAQVASFLRGGPDAAGVVGVGAGVEVRAPRSDSLGSEQLELSRGKEQLLRQVAAFLHGWGQVGGVLLSHTSTHAYCSVLCTANPGRLPSACVCDCSPVCLMCILMV